MRKFWRKYHKWVGIVFAVFILLFCLSGIVLNHRRTFASWEVSRAWLPSSYHFDNYNNGIVRGTVRLDSQRVWLYGNAGVWQTDAQCSQFKEMNEGLPEGIDHRRVNNVVVDGDGTPWCAALYGVYRWDGQRWQDSQLDADGERISDVTLRGDTLVVVARSYIYTAVKPYALFERHALKTPEGYSPRVSLFKQVWQLHSGELFGLGGRLVVDAVALVIVFLCLSGIVWFFLPGIIRRRKKHGKSVAVQAATMQKNARWHNRLGAWTLVLTLLLAITGASLRPPLMIPLAITKTAPFPGSTLDSDNAFHDKLRAARWDARMACWLLSTSDGFYRLDDFEATPTKLNGAPSVSPMGINVFERADSTSWLVGSFSGLFRWNPSDGTLLDYFTDKKPEGGMHGFTVGASVTGYSADLTSAPVIFEYGRGARTKADADRSPLPSMPAELSAQPMSLWNFALELHVGRCYSPLIGPLSSLFVFLSGTLLALVLLSGYILYRKPKRRK